MRTTGGSAASRTSRLYRWTRSPTASQPAKNVRDEPDEAPHDVAPAPPPRRPATPTVNTWTVNWQLLASNNSTLTFRAPPAPWYRTREQSTSVAPQASTTAQPAPSSASPTPINPAPPPPTPTEDTGSADTQPWICPAAPEPTQKPGRRGDAHTRDPGRRSVWRPSRGHQQKTTPPPEGMAAARAGADGDLHRAIRS
jgi:hypothetical protein